jgi:hypothetical protein
MYFSVSSQPNGIPFQHRHGYWGRDRGRGTGVICCLHLHCKTKWFTGCISNLQPENSLEDYNYCISLIKSFYFSRLYFFIPTTILYCSKD